LRTAESHLDSAIIQCREYTRQQQQRLELETIYRIDQIRDQDLTFEEMISAVLSELSTAVHAETGYIMFKDGDGNRLKLQGSLHSDLHLLAQYYDLIEEYSSEAMQAGKLICHNEINQDVRSLICIPLILRGRHLGAFGAVNRTSKHGFNSADRQILESIASQVDTAIFERQEQRRLRETLSRSVGPGVMDWLLKRDGKDVLRGHRQMVTILYADIRGSTSLAEETEPALLVEFINDYLGTMAQVILKNEGTLDKFVGDEVMALFGAPMPQQDQALRAVQVAHKMQGAHHLLMDQWEKRGVRRSPIGIGIATDEIIVGEFGCPERTDFTVMGRAANLGARLCSAAEGGKILISQRTYEEMQATLEDEDQSIDSVENEVELKGLGTVTFYELK
jgi:adenylate cyclase